MLRARKVLEVSLNEIRWADAARRIQTVGIILGPYRNLTTLTASLLSLHPACQVLNHGGRVLKGRADFIARRDEASLRRFCAQALAASTGGEHGDFGGSIRLSHAFERPALAERYEARYGDRWVKPQPICLVWKESQAVTNLIRSADLELATLITEMKALRFLLPVRNPIDCAFSNVRTTHAVRIPGADPNNVLDVLDKIIETIAWFDRRAPRTRHICSCTSRMTTHRLSPPA
jgi:hypothetical protein